MGEVACRSVSCVASFQQIADGRSYETDGSVAWYNGKYMRQTKLPDRLRTILRAMCRQDAVALTASLAEVASTLYERLREWRAPGIYEVLAHDTVLELKDVRGELATVTRRESVRFLQNHVAAITDHAWGDGKIFHRYSCSPGVPVDIYQDGSRYTVLVSLREIKHRGDELNFVIRRKIIGGFRQRGESWETEVYHRTGRLSVSLIFPPQRLCQRATVTQRSTSKTVALGADHFGFLQDGRQRVAWEVRNPRLYDRYSLKWHW